MVTERLANRGLPKAHTQDTCPGRLHRAVRVTGNVRRKSKGAAIRNPSARRIHSVGTLTLASTEEKAAPYRVTEDGIRDIQSLYKSCLFEYDYEVDDAWVEGTIPRELQGTYFRNGPGLQVNNPRYKRHTFDGDGMILSFTFEDGKVRFKNKFVRTKGFVDEQTAGKPVYRTAFTRGSADGNPLFNPFDFQLKNCANTGVLYWGGRLLALYESGLPHELRAHDLETVGESRLGGRLETPVLAAHYRVMTEEDGSKTWVAFSANTGLGGTEMLFYEFAEEGSLRSPTVRHPLKDVSLAMVHDIAVTQDYYVVVMGPIQFSPSKFVTEYITSRCSIAECLVYNPSATTKIHLVPRPKAAAAGKVSQTIEAPAMFTFHHANAYQMTVQPANSSNSSNGTEDRSSPSAAAVAPASGAAAAASGGKELVVLDTVGWETISFDANQHNLSPDYYKGGQRTQLRRLVFELSEQPAAAGGADSSSSSRGSSGRLVADHKVVQRCTEFPSVAWDMHGQPHRYLYCCGDIVDDAVYWGPAQSVMKVELDPREGLQGAFDQQQVKLDVWKAGERALVGEPLFVPRPGAASEDDGWVLVTVHNAAADKGELVILDAKNLQQGPVATLHLPHFLPAGLHGSWCPQVFQEGDTGLPKWREPNVVREL